MSSIAFIHRGISVSEYSPHVKMSRIIFTKTLSIPPHFIEFVAKQSIQNNRFYHLEPSESDMQKDQDSIIFLNTEY